MSPDNKFTEAAGIEHPIICGAMYPCSNPELVAAASEAGGIGIIQPVSMVFVHGHKFDEGLHYLRTLTQKPLGMNVLVEQSSKTYEKRMQIWVDEAIEAGIKFFVTALGNPTWVIKKARQIGGTVYHDVTNEKWAQKAVDYGVDGLICVNNRAGGHAGTESPQDLYQTLKKHQLPMICAGGIGDRKDYLAALAMGYAGVQMGTRFIATKECKVHSDYQDAIIRSHEDDVVLTDRITGVPVSVIKTPQVEKMGTKAGPIARRLLQHRKTKHFMRMLYTLKSVWQLKHASQSGSSYKDFFQAGKSVEGIHSVKTVQEVFDEFTA